MSFLCSTMIPSYRRPGLVIGAIKSFGHKGHQAIVRLSDADPTAAEQKERILSQCGNTQVIIGPHLSGYESLGAYYTEMLPLCQGEWINIWDDDMEIRGPWYTGLTKAPHESVVVCENYTLGPSEYGPGSLDGQATGWFMHFASWKNTGEIAIGFPPDDYGMKFSRDHAWPIHRLPRTRLVHDWQRPIDGDR